MRSLCLLFDSPPPPPPRKFAGKNSFVFYFDMILVPFFIFIFYFFKFHAISPFIRFDVNVMADWALQTNYLSIYSLYVGLVGHTHFSREGVSAEEQYPTHILFRRLQIRCGVPSLNILPLLRRKIVGRMKPMFTETAS